MESFSYHSLTQAGFIPSIGHLLQMSVLVAALLVPLEATFPSHATVLRSDTKLLDIMYWFFTPVLTRMFTNGILLVLISGLFFIQGRAVTDAVYDGFGPLILQPLWLQTLEILILADLIDYWSHRLFHRRFFWPFHAIHHSSQAMNWVASARMHPMNDLLSRICQVLPLMALGFSLNGIIVVVPYLFFYVVFVHSNLQWDFGPFRYLLVSPLYHQWHHTSDTEGLDKNFAGIFPVWDILFGTCHFPRRVPKMFGVTHDKPPETLTGQLMYPFKRWLPARSSKLKNFS